MLKSLGAGLESPLNLKRLAWRNPISVKMISDGNSNHLHLFEYFVKDKRNIQGCFDVFDYELCQLFYRLKRYRICQASNVTDTQISLLNYCNQK